MTTLWMDNILQTMYVGLADLSLNIFFFSEIATLDTEPNYGASQQGLKRLKDTLHTMFMGKIFSKLSKGWSLLAFLPQLLLIQYPTIRKIRIFEPLSFLVSRDYKNH